MRFDACWEIVFPENGVSTVYNSRPNVSRPSKSSPPETCLSLQMLDDVFFSSNPGEKATPQLSAKPFLTCQEFRDVWRNHPLSMPGGRVVHPLLRSPVILWAPPKCSQKLLKSYPCFLNIGFPRPPVHPGITSFPRPFPCQLISVSFGR